MSTVLSELDPKEHQYELSFSLLQGFGDELFSVIGNVRGVKLDRQQQTIWKKGGTVGIFNPICSHGASQGNHS